MTNINNRNLIVAALILVIMVLITYWRTFDNSFVDWDDFTYVVNNELVRNPEKTGIGDIFRTPVSSNWHPLTILSMRMNGNECSDCPNGISPAPFIRWNIILHIVNTILVLLFVMKLARGNLLVSFFVAAIFGIHPMHIESVAWISERKDVLYSFFFLSGLLAYIKFRDEGKYRWLLLTFLLFVLSCLSKAVAVVFPVAILLVDYWFLSQPGGKKFIELLRELFQIRKLVILIPFIVVSIITGLLAYRIQDGHNFLGILDLSRSTPDVVNAAGPFSVWEKFKNGSYGFIAYIIKFIAPAKLVAFYPYPGSPELENPAYSILLNAAPAAMLILLAAVVYSMKKTSLFSFGAGFYLVTIILVLQFIPVGYAIIADRYSYLPYIGLAFIAGTIISQKLRNRKLQWGVSGVFILLLMILSVRQADAWHNSETLWTKTLEKFPKAEVARRSRGKLYSKLALQSKNPADRQKYEGKALKDFEVAVSAGSGNAEVFEGLGVIYGSKGQHATALKFLDAALKLDNDNGSILYNRALTYGRMNRNEAALKDYTEALKYSPEKAIMIRTNRSNLLLSMKRFSEAVSDLDYLIQNGTPDFNMYYNRAVAKQLTNNFEGAISDYRKALEINPKDDQARKQMEDLINLTRERE